MAGMQEEVARGFRCQGGGSGESLFRKASRWFPHFRPVFSDDDISIATYGVPFSVALAVWVLFVHRSVGVNLYVSSAMPCLRSATRYPPTPKF